MARPRLARRLVGERDASTVVIAAPPGYGKTALLAEWAEHDPRPFIWAALCERHNDPAHLLTSLALALDELEPLDPGLLEAALALDGAGSPGEVEDLLSHLTPLLAAMGATRQPAVLVLDDLQTLRCRQALDVVSAFAAAMSPAGKLAVASRGEPDLSLGRLRVEHSLLELGADDLAMTSYEAHQLLAGSGVELGRADLERLVAVTEGWPAGLYLASLSLRTEPDAGAAVRGFTGEEHSVRAYVTDEILAPLVPELREFLVRTSVLAVLSSGACDAVLERVGSAGVLAELSSSGLMLAPIDSGHRRFRCQSMLRNVLLVELETAHADEVEDLHMRAAAWCTAQGDMEAAVDHAVASGDADRAGGLIWEHFAAGAHQTPDARLERWLGAFREDQVADCAALALSAAHVQLGMGRLDLAERWARAASGAIEREPDVEPPRSIVAGLALIEAAAGREGPARMNEQAERAYALVDEDSPWRPACCLLRGVFRHLSGDRDGAREMFGEAVHRSAAAASQTEVLALAQIALMDAEDLDWECAQDRVGLAVERMTAHGLADHATSALVLAISAWIAGRQGNAEQAKRDLRRASTQLGKLDAFMPWYLVETRVVLARVAIRLGDVVQARALLSQASRVVRSTEDCPVFHTWLDDAWGMIDELSAVALSGPSSLTMAELRILRFLPTHLSFREIGERLHVSTNTVKSQAHSIYGKLGTSSRSQAVARAAALGLISVTVV